MKIRTFHLLVICGALISLSACAQAGQGESTATNQPTQPLSAAELTPTGLPAGLGTPATFQGQTPAPAYATPTPFPMPSAQAAQSQIEQAKQDLAGRLSIKADQIVLTDFQEIAWPDSSLGCPQPGMAYTQAIVDGIAIQFQVNDRVYSYHGDGNHPPFLCERIGPIGPMEPPKK